jgi:recombination protein RecA
MKARELMGKVKGKALDHFVPLDRSQIDSIWPHISPGNVKFEYVLGGEFDAKGRNACPGYPRGTITNVFGPEHCGKTSTALHAASAVCGLGGSAMYIDYENVLDVRYAAKLGIPVQNPSQFALFQPETLEQGVAALCVAANEGVDLIVFDSVGAAQPKDFFSMSMKDIIEAKIRQVGLQARTWANMLPMITNFLKSHGTALIAIAQTRTDIPKQGQKSVGPVVQGGKSWKFYSAVRMELQFAGKIKGKRYNAMTHEVEDAVIGSRVRAVMRKSKISATTHYETLLDCMPSYGFDPLRAAAEVALSHNVIKKSGAWYTWVGPDDKEIKVQGYSNLIRTLREIPGISEQINSVVRPLLCRRSTIPEEEYEDEVFEEDTVEVDESGLPAMNPETLAKIATGDIEGLKAEKPKGKSKGKSKSKKAKGGKKKGK